MWFTDALPPTRKVAIISHTTFCAVAINASARAAHAIIVTIKWRRSRMSPRGTKINCAMPAPAMPSMATPPVAVTLR